VNTKITITITIEPPTSEDSSWRATATKNFRDFSGMGDNRDDAVCALLRAVDVGMEEGANTVAVATIRRRAK
jgi:hypothetical protein